MPRPRHFLIPWLICGVINAQNVVQTVAGFEHPDPLQNLFQHHHQFQQQQLALGLPQHQLPPQLPPHPMLQHPLSAGAIPTLPPHHFMSHPFFFNHPAFLQHQLVAATAPPSLMATTTGRANIPPQAVKPSIQSDVKAFTEKNRPIDRSVEKLQTVSAEVRSPLAYSPAKELRKVEIVPVEHVLEPLVTTTQTIILTTTATRMATTTTTSEPSTTNLPQKIEEDRQNAEKNGETLDLIKHLNSSDLENFLQSANLTTKEAQRFLKLVEKVLEEELSKRLHNKTLDGDTTDNHEVKTVDTHLKFDEADLPTVSPSATSAPKPSTTTGTPVIVAALSQKSGPSEKLTGSTVAIHSLEDVRKREQEEFDRLLGQIVLETKDDNDENEDDDLLLSANGEKPAVTPRNNFRPTTRHPPKTEFEHLVEDYRYRLSSSNGFNDLIKALRNAHIGFFDRSPVKRRPIGK